MENKRLVRYSAERLRNVMLSVALISKLFASFIVAAYEGWVRNQRAVVSTFKQTPIIPPGLLLFLSALTGYVSRSTSKIDPVLQALRLPAIPAAIKWFPRKDVSLAELAEPEPEKSVYVEVLHDPSPEPIRADVIFIHGLHGSVIHTWKQGLWHYRKDVVNRTLSHTIKLNVDNPNFSANNNLAVDDNATSSTVPVGDECDSAIVIGREKTDHDLVVENITDIINNIDDKIKARDVRDMVGDEAHSGCWPRDWLPQDCPGVRVIALNYTTDPFLWRPAWISKRIRTSLKDRSREMWEILLGLGVGQNPIVWVGHSKGGLFVKQMLVDARYSDDPRLKRFLFQTRGIMFYSVPHRGSALAHLNLPLLRQSIELTEVKKDCSEVISLHKEFTRLYEEKLLSADIFSFVETILTFMFITNVRVVSVESADLGFGAFQGVNIDHREICKPLNRNCFLYRELINLINKVV